MVFAVVFMVLQMFGHVFGVIARRGLDGRNR